MMRAAREYLNRMMASYGMKRSQRQRAEAATARPVPKAPSKQKTGKPPQVARDQKSEK